jgi:DNA-directed RNA polymerase specialized sigma24 family protein
VWGSDNVGNITIDKAIEIGVQAGVKEALDRIQKHKEDKFKYRHDKRLRNTKLLLRNYNKFRLHCKNAVYTSSEIDELNAIDVLDQIDSIDDEGLYINSIKKTHDRTYIIIKHINRMVQLYKYSAEMDNDSNALRRYKVITIVYMSVKSKTYKEIAEELEVSEKTITRDIRQAVEELSSLIFGIDGLKLES